MKKSNCYIFLTTLLLLLVYTPLCKGANAFEEFQVAPAKSWHEVAREEREELKKMVLYEGQQQRLAEEARWKEEKNNYYAKAGASIGASGYDGMMDKAGLSDPGMKSYFQEKYFNTIDEQINEISKYAAAHGGHKPESMLSNLHKLLSDPKMTEELRKYSVMSGELDKNRAAYDKLPDWKKASVSNPWFFSPMEKTEEGWKIKDEYDLTGEKKATAQSNWDNMTVPESTYSIEDLEKHFEKIHPKGGTYGYSRKEAYNEAKNVIAKLTNQQKSDLGLEFLYKTSPEIFKLYTTGKHKDGSPITKDELNEIHGMMERPYMQTAKEYADSWVYSKDPTASNKAQEAYYRAMANQLNTPLREGAKKGRRHTRQIRREHGYPLKTR